MSVQKIVNDPVHGFITIDSEVVMHILSHPWFQRLRRISQTGLLNLVYPGATHTRFHHALGAMYLMQLSLQTLMKKGVDVSPEEYEAAQIAILLHDIGHGPFSHALESVLVKDFHHEHLSLLMMKELNKEFGGTLDVAIRIFTGCYEKHFLHSLISGQLDMDRMDYLKRDAFYTGVVEGNVNAKRLITMLNVNDHQLVLEDKGIYSVEHFLTARMFMYWQVYFHKTAVAAEQILVDIFRRVRELVQNNVEVPCYGNLKKVIFPNPEFTFNNILEAFTLLDDVDVLSHIKYWASHEDRVLSLLCSAVVYRHLPKIQVSGNGFTNEEYQELVEKTEEFYGVGSSNYLVKIQKRKLLPYDETECPILLAEKKGKLYTLSAHPSTVLSQALLLPTEKYYLSYPRTLA